MEKLICFASIFIFKAGDWPNTWVIVTKTISSSYKEQIHTQTAVRG